MPIGLSILAKLARYVDGDNPNWLLSFSLVPPMMVDNGPTDPVSLFNHDAQRRAEDVPQSRVRVAGGYP